MTLAGGAAALWTDCVISDATPSFALRKALAVAQTQTDLLASGAAETTIFVRLFTVPRVFTGLVWRSNRLAKVLEKSNNDIGCFSFNPVDTSTARAILTDAEHRTGVRPLGRFYELAVGVGLVLGIATRLAAVVGLQAGSRCC